jgi:hypothetical protein
MPQLALSSQQQTTARNAAVQAANLGYAHEPELHYTQGASRWQGIDQAKNASKGQYPTQADCSSFVTWCIWNALWLPYQMEDVVNASSWNAGYTGTMLANGTALGRASDMLPGDAVIYGSAGSTGAHTAIVVVAGSTPTVISHGSEAGPYRLAYNYRSDIQSLRRYIDGKPHEAVSTGPSPTPTPPPKEADYDMVCTVLNSAGALHVFAASGKAVTYTWQRKGETSWNGGKSGTAPAGMTPFTTATEDIVGIDAALNNAGALHLFVHGKSGKTYYTWQKKGESAWDGGKSGQAVAGLTLFAP